MFGTQRIAEKWGVGRRGRTRSLVGVLIADELGADTTLPGMSTTSTRSIRLQAASPPGTKQRSRTRPNRIDACAFMYIQLASQEQIRLSSEED